MTPLLENAILRIDAGEMVALIGPNGSGKTTLLRRLAGLGDDRGVGCNIGGRRLSSISHARRTALLGFLPASREVQWPIPVRDVIALGLVRNDPERVQAVLAALDLADLAERAIDRLSTGERARALLGRVLVARPAMLLLDEPLSNLDPAWSLRILDLLRGEARRGTGLLVSLHDLSLLNAFDRAVMIEGMHLIADLPPRDMLASDEFERVFAVRPSGTGWALSPSADRQSSQ